MDPIEEAVARAIHAEFQRDFPKFTHRELDALDEATGVAARFRRMARAAISAHLAALEAAGFVVLPSKPSSIWVRPAGQKQEDPLP